MQKILILGNCGTGKTTFAKQLSQHLNLPLLHLDYYYWKSNWKKPEKEKWRVKVHKLVKGNSWIIDGNYQSTFDIRVPVSDTIIFLDLPKYVSLFRIIKRYLKNHDQVRFDIGGGNLEKLDWQFIKWVVSFSRKRILKQLYSHMTNQRFVHLKSQGEIDQFLETIKT